MGLLSHIENKKQLSEGLLFRAEHLDLTNNKSEAQDTIDFPAFILSAGIDCFGIYAQDGEFLYLAHCSGFDLVSIKKSLSTKDFWKGLAQGKSGWLDFAGSSLSPLYQLFSSEMRDKITEIHILPFSAAGKSFLFLTTAKIDTGTFPANALEQYVSKDFAKDRGLDTNQLTGNIERGLEISNASLFIASAKLSLESAFTDIASPLKEKLKATAFKQLCLLTERFFPAPNCCVPCRNEEFKIAVFSKEELGDKLLEFQLNASTRKFFCNESSDNLLILSAGRSQSTKGTVSFLTDN